MRQVKYIARNKEFLITRVFQSVFLGLVLGSLFWNIQPDDYPDRLGLIIYMCIQAGFSNFVEIPIAVEQKMVMFKQVAAGFYPGVSAVSAATLLHLPIAIFESLLIGT